MNDERTALDDIRKCLEKYFQEAKEECVVYEFENPNVFLHEYSSKYDLIFLDIQMAGKDGPAGIFATLIGGSKGMAYPIEVVIASTWNVELAKNSALLSVMMLCWLTSKFGMLQL